MSVEEDERHLAGFVVHMYTVGNAAIAPWRNIVTVDPDPQRSSYTFRGVGNARLAAAVDDVMRQMKQKVADLSGPGCLIALKDPGHCFLKFWTNTGDRRYRFEQRVEEFWPHLPHSFDDFTDFSGVTLIDLGYVTLHRGAAQILNRLQAIS